MWRRECLDLGELIASRSGRFTPEKEPEHTGSNIPAFFLVAFGKLQKTIISFMSVRPLAPIGQTFRKFDA